VGKKGCTYQANIAHSGYAGRKTSSIDAGRRKERPGEVREARSGRFWPHIAYEDAEAYVHWAGKEVPTESEWGLAARGGLEGKKFTWGDEHLPEWKGDGKLLAGRVPLAEHAARQLRGNLSGRLFPAQRLWTIRYGGQRLGIDLRLVCSAPCGRNRQVMLRPNSQPTHRFA
jgi:formylglycine-generating enzyme required for sulfatase activity